MKRRGTIVSAIVLLVALGSVVSVVRAVDGDGRPGANSGQAETSPGAARAAPILTGRPIAADESWQRSDLVLTHGVASGDVSSSAARVWARASAASRMHVDLATNRRFRGARRHTGGIARRENDFAVTMRLRRLRPATRYFYRVWFSELRPPRRRSSAVPGSFKTAPGYPRAGPVRFAFGGDVGSGDFCRHAEHGFPTFFYMTKVPRDFFVSLGDMIYADSSCSPDGPDGPGGWRNVPGRLRRIDDPSVDWRNRSAVQEIYFEHWRYTRADRHLSYLLTQTPIYSVWDDHEVINDFGASWSYWNSTNAQRPGFRNLVEAGRRALFAYGVLGRDRTAPDRMYRSFRWGKDLLLLLLDTRSYRSRNDQRDSAGSGKTMLGAAQLAWLKRSLADSDAAWNVVASSVSVAVPTGSEQFGRDGWADGETGNGFERELLDLLRFLDQRNVKNLVFITADLHFAQVTRHERDYDGNGDSLRFHEIVAGPLNARTRAPYWLDQTTNPTSLYGEGNLFNFGYAEVARRKDGRAYFRVETRDSFGQARPGSVLELRPG